MRLMSPVSLVAIVVVCLAGAALFTASCKTDVSAALRSADGQAGSSAAAAPGASGASACAAVCNVPPDELAPDYKIVRARCYACRCKEAFGGYLPTPEELQCSKGVDVPIYKLVGPDAETDLQPLTGKVGRCVNPSMLEEGTCAPGSRLGQIVKGSIFFKWICRHRQYDAKYADPKERFDDFGIIGYNAENGVACFWDGKLAGMACRLRRREAGLPRLLPREIRAVAADAGALQLAADSRTEGGRRSDPGAGREWDRAAMNRTDPSGTRLRWFPRRPARAAGRSASGHQAAAALTGPVATPSAAPVPAETERGTQSSS